MSAKSPNYGLPHLVTIALYMLGGDKQYVHLEDIALRVNEIAPGRFTWRKYPQYVDLSAVMFALQHAKKPQYGTLVSRDKTSNWILTTQGVAFAKTADLSKLSSKPRSGSDTERIELEIQRLKQSKIFKLYQQEKLQETTRQDFQEFAKINEYFQTRARQRRFGVIELAVRQDPQLEEIWNALKIMFAEEMK
jgi:hypothetical protein